ncbi:MULTISPECIES: chemotaxis protein CheA [Kyrpidia]|uniref:chemotaxis protein CheA n=1 Tax=Kyrpidia TaxID=1129704 RepID=UPI001472BEC0|nr:MULTISPECIES: chemotaxis protein CheA [Kyrpidia]MCL6574742.1 chemotaxis protein CheA [Kyrpidia sp.]
MENSEYLDMFIEETKEHLQQLNEQLLVLERDSSDHEAIHAVFRSAHTIKGMAATMGFEPMVWVTHDMENVLDEIRNGRAAITPDHMDVLFKAVDLLEAQLAAVEEGGDLAGIPTEDVVQGLQRLLDESRGMTGAPDAGSGSAGKGPSAGRTGGGREIDSSQGPALVLDAYQESVAEEARREGLQVVSIAVRLDEGCILKAARAYMVVDACEQFGELVKVDPPVEELEQGNLDLDIRLLLILKQESPEAVEKALLGISEIREVVVKPWAGTTGNGPSPERLAPRGKGERNGSGSESDSPKGVRTTALGGSPEERATNHRTLKSVRVDIDRLDTLMNLFSELVIDRTRIEELAKQTGHQDLLATVEHMVRISADLQNLVMTIRMVPVDTVFNRFPRMVRDLARELGKSVDFVVRGGDTGLDRTVIDEIGDPLVHLLRNAVDHGIETPEERRKLGKPEAGRVELVAYHSGNNVFIEVSDDGRGVDREKVIQKAVQRGLIDRSDAASLTDGQVFDLLFQPGFSTKDTVSDVSGRGVGLDVVKRKLEQVGGKVTVESISGRGTKWVIQLPLTLSIIQAMLVSLAGEKYAVPLHSIVETAVVNRGDIRDLHGQQVIPFRGRVIPLIDLERLYELRREETKDEENVLIVRRGDRFAGFIVDEFLGQQEIVLKSLGRYLQQVFSIAGATVLGDGQVALIIDCNAFLAA